MHRIINKINLEDVVEKINSKYNIDLKSILQAEEIGDKSVYIYVYMYILADSILKELPDVIYKKEDEIYCVNVRKMVEHFNIDITECELNREQNRVFQIELNGYMDFYKFLGIDGIIYVEEKMLDYTKRYVITVALAHYIISSIKKNEPTMQYLYESLFFKCPEERLCIILAVFILMPIDIVLELITTYITDIYENRCGIISHRNEASDKYTLIIYLARRLIMSEFYVTIGFEYIKHLMEILYNYNGELPIENICQKIRNYNNLFR